MDMRELARLGAHARLKEIQMEMEAIRRAFPEEQGRRLSSVNIAVGGGRDAASAELRPTRTGQVASGPKRRTMSAAARRKISQAQKKRWARQRQNGASTK